MMSEKERIEQVYAERERTIPTGRYSHFNQGNLFIHQERERKILRLLEKHGMAALAEKSILDVGCGAGGEIRNILRYGAVPEHISGIDMLGNRIAHARKVNPNVNYIEGSATELPFSDNSFDIIMQYTVFTSIHDVSIRSAIAAEMLRVLRPTGIIIWYDFRYSNPYNNNVWGISAGDIRDLFPGCSFDMKTLTLLPPLARRLAPYSWIACHVLGKIPFMRSHILAAIYKQR